MKFKGTLIVVKDCNKALKFYQDMFGLELIRDNDGNMELSGNLYLQEEKCWERFTGRRVIPQGNQTELYFEEPEIDSFVKKLEKLYPDIEYVNHLMTHSWESRSSDSMIWTAISSKLAPLYDPCCIRGRMA